MPNYKVIDSFLFNGEFEMLLMRLDYLFDSVEHFVICESTYTQNGKKKDLTFPTNEHLFKNYLNKISYIVYDPDAEDIKISQSNSWHLEKKHIDFIRDNILHLSDEETVTMFSGVDEFPNKDKFDEMWERISTIGFDSISFSMRTFYYSPICELLINCFGTNVLNDFSLRNIDRLSSLRDYTFSCQHIEDGGWHFSFFNSPEFNKKKIESYAHSEFNLPEITNLENIKHRMYNCLDILARPEINILKHERISDIFPIEFYRHKLFFSNIFDVQILKPYLNNQMHDQIFENYRSIQIQSESFESENPIYKMGQIFCLETFLVGVSSKQDHILDAGCGDGTGIFYLKERGFENLFGVDINPNKYKLAKLNLGEDRIIDSDITHTPFSDCQFDKVWCSHVLEHSYDPLESLKELKRITKPGGFVFIVLPYPTHHSDVHCGVNDLKLNIPDRAKSTISILEQNGFNVEQYYIMNVREPELFVKIRI